MSTHRSQKEWAGGEGSEGRVSEGRDSGQPVNVWCMGVKVQIYVIKGKLY